ncbi:MAG: N-acetylmuramoyl-L-alanine amidase [Winogradskyella sp.]
MTLQTRLRRANRYPANNSLNLSIHANAGGGTGSEMCTFEGFTQSDRFATVFGQEFESEFPNEKLRKDWIDGDLDKERNFYVLKHTKMPAVLTENFLWIRKESAKIT